MKGSALWAVCKGRKGEAVWKLGCYPTVSEGEHGALQLWLEISLSALFSGQGWPTAPLCQMEALYKNDL